jgi:membrane-bound hydrogenase subunit beta
MSTEERVSQDLIKAFNFLEGHVYVQRPRRIFVKVPAEHFQKVFDHLVGHAGFTILCAITGLDEGATLGALYHLAQEGGTVLTLATAVPKEAPVIHTVTSTFPAADAYERELVDLLGIQVEGLKPGNRYPLPDNWPAGEYPLRKDWKGPKAAYPVEKKESVDA